MFFSSIQEINRLRKEMNSLLNKECQIYLKVTIKKNQNFDFWGPPTDANIIEF